MANSSLAQAQASSSATTGVIVILTVRAGVTRDFAGGNELLESGLCARKEALAGFSQPDTACGADEESGADTRLESAHRLTDRRRTDAEFCGRSTKAAMLRNAQESLDAVERALPHCEALLHSLPTLSRIVARWKRS